MKWAFQRKLVLFFSKQNIISIFKQKCFRASLFSLISSLFGFLTKNSYFCHQWWCWLKEIEILFWHLNLMCFVVCVKTANVVWKRREDTFSCWRSWIREIWDKKEKRVVIFNILLLFSFIHSFIDDVYCNSFIVSLNRLWGTRVFVNKQTSGFS